MQGLSCLLDDFDVIEVHVNSGLGVDDGEHGVDGDGRNDLRVLAHHLERQSKKNIGIHLNTEREKFICMRIVSTAPSVREYEDEYLGRQTCVYGLDETVSI